MKTILVVGGTNIDDVIFLDQDLPLDGKTNAAYSARMIGGGGANVAISLQILGKIFQNPPEVTLCTKLGQNAETPQILHDLAAGGIKTLDMFAPYSTTSAHNTVIAHKQGRSILRLGAFNHAAPAIPPEEQLALKAAVARADLVFVQTKHPRIAMMAAAWAAEKNIPVVVDFSNKECPDSLLDYAGFALLPAEFRFSGMAQDSGEKALLDHVAARVPYAAISDASKATLRSAAGQYAHIPSSTVETKDSLGAGDLRDAAFCFFLLRDNAPDTALRKANIIASLSCEYYGREWADALGERLQSFPEFADDLAPDTPAISVNDLANG